MSHHGNNDPPGPPEWFKKALEENGYTRDDEAGLAELSRSELPGKYPNGKLGPNDEGQFQMAIAHIKGRVIVDFGKPMAWIGLTSVEARQIAETLLKHAREIEIEQEAKGNG